MYLTLVIIFQMRNPLLNTLKHNVRDLVLFVKNAIIRLIFVKKIRLRFNVKNVDIRLLFAAEPL